MKKEKPEKLSLSERAVLSEKDKKFDPKATEESCVQNLRSLQETHPLKYITRNFYRVHGKYSDSTWSQFFGTFHEFRRHAGLELSRNQHLLEKKIAKHASLDVYRRFYEEEILPYHQKYDFRKDHSKGRFKRVLVGSDFHDIDVDEFCLSVFIDTAKRTQPDVICLNGDIFDLYEFSRYTIDPRKVAIKERFDFVKHEIFAPLRAACPKAQIDLIIGNHELRILKLMADKTPSLRILLSDVMGLSLSDVFGLDDHGINLVSKLDLAAFQQSDMNDEIKQNYQVYYDLFIACHFKDLQFGISGTSGHTHRPEQITFANIPMGKLTWTTTGCMAKTDAEYIEGFNKAQNSFLMVLIDREKRQVNHQHILIPGDSVVVEGKLYARSDSWSSKESPKRSR